MQYTIHAATATTAAMVIHPPGWKYITIDGDDPSADRFRVGAYVDWSGRIFKVTERRASDDWFSSDVYITLRGAGSDENPFADSPFTQIMRRLPWAQRSTRVRWLEDFLGKWRDDSDDDWSDDD